MGQEITEAKKIMVIRLYFEGLPYGEIAQKVGIAKGSVAAIVAELKDGHFPQFEQMTELLNELREMVVALRKSQLSPTEAIYFFAVVKKFVALGVEPAQLESWVKMCRAMPEGEFTQSQVIQAAIKLAKLEQTGTSHEQTLENLKTSAAELAKLQAAVADLKAEETQLRRRKEELLQTNQRLEAESTRLQGKLNAMAVNEQSEESRLRDLNKQIKPLQEKREQLETEKKQLEKENSQIQDRIQTLEKQVTDKTEVLKNLDKLGFSRHQLEVLRDRLTEISKSHSTSEAVSRFFSYLSDYEHLLGMEVTKEKLTAEVNNLNEEKRALTRLSLKLELTSEQVTEGIAVLKSLQRKGVLPPTIVSYQHMLSATGLAPETFEKLANDFGGVEKALAAKKSTLDTVDLELEEKRRALQELRGELAKVKQSITTLGNSAIKNIDSARTSAVNGINILCRQLQDDITRWGDMRAKTGKLEEELKLARYFVKLPLSDEALSRLVEDIGAPVVMQYLTIALTWCQKKLNPKVRPPRAILKKYYSIGEYSEVELTDLITWSLVVLTEGINNVQGRIK